MKESSPNDKVMRTTAKTHLIFFVQMWLWFMWGIELVGCVLYPWPWQPSLLETSLCSSPSSRSLSSAVKESGSSTFCRGWRGGRQKEEGRERTVEEHDNLDIFTETSLNRFHTIFYLLPPTQPLQIILGSPLWGCFKKKVKWWTLGFFLLCVLYMFETVQP